MEIRWFSDDHELEAFINAVERALNQQRQVCAWSGFEFELWGDTPGEVERLRAAFAGTGRFLQILVSYTQVYDLSRYSARIEDIGVEKAYYSPYIAKKKTTKAGFPTTFSPSSRSSLKARRNRS